ncbi:MAG: transcriptional regulator [Candidatus Binatia bacterium]
MRTEPGELIVFGPYRIDVENQQLWRGEQVVALQPKPLAVLQYLAERPGEVVSSKELLKTVWAGTVVTKAVVKECLRAIRGALREDVASPQYLETVGREGYRFLTPFTTTTPVSSSEFGHSALRTQSSVLSTRFWWAGKRNWRNYTSG